MAQRVWRNVNCPNFCIWHSFTVGRTALLRQLSGVKMLWGMRRGNCIGRQTVNRAMTPIGPDANRPMEPPMRKPKQRKPLNDLSRSLTTLDANHTLIAVIEMGQQSWLVAGIVPGVERQPLKKLDTDENALLKLLARWRLETQKP